MFSFAIMEDLGQGTKVYDVVLTEVVVLVVGINGDSPSRRMYGLGG